MNQTMHPKRALGACALALGVVAASARAQVTPSAFVLNAEGDVPAATFDLASALMAPQGGLTAEDVALRVRARAPQLFAARAQAAAARYRAEGAWIQFLPVVELGAHYKHVKRVVNSGVFPAPDLSELPPEVQAVAGQLTPSAATFTQPVQQYALSAVLQYPISDVFLRVWPSYRAAVSLQDAADIQTEVVEAAVTWRAQTVFYDYARALAQRAVGQQAVAQAEAQAQQIGAFVEVGKSAPADLLTAQARLEEARSALVHAEARVVTTRHNLATLLGADAWQIGGLAEPVLEPPLAPLENEAQLVQRALAQRAELRALHKQVGAGEDVQRAERGSAVPQLVLSASDLYGAPNPRYIPPNTSPRNSWEVGASLVWRINASVTGGYAAHEAGARVAKLRADLAAQEEEVRMDVVSAYQSFQAATAMTRACRARLSAAEEAYRLRLATYRVGAGVIVDLMDADMNVSQARLALASAAISARAALVTLRRAAALKN
jgi:outer membrane protein TolC